MYSTLHCNLEYRYQRLTLKRLNIQFCRIYPFWYLCPLAKLSNKVPPFVSGYYNHMRTSLRYSFAKVYLCYLSAKQFKPTNEKPSWVLHYKLVAIIWLERRYYPRTWKLKYFFSVGNKYFSLAWKCESCCHQLFQSVFVWIVIIAKHYE